MIPKAVSFGRGLGCARTVTFTARQSRSQRASTGTRTSSSASMRATKAKSGAEPSPPHLSPFTLYPSPFALHPSPCTLHPAPCTLHPAPRTIGYLLGLPAAETYTPLHNTDYDLPPGMHSELTSFADAVSILQGDPIISGSSTLLSTLSSAPCSPLYRRDCAAMQEPSYSVPMYPSPSPLPHYSPHRCHLD